MKEYSDGKAYLLRFDRGEEVMTSLLRWTKKKKLGGAFLTGLGAVENPHLGYFDAEKRGYIDKKFQGEFEIASLAGNLSWDAGEGDGEVKTKPEPKPIAHMHVVIAGPNFLAFGGHLYSAVVSGTVEIAVTPIDTKLVRKYTEELNLKLLAD
jgi:predicted DNA-binding protein with PD1-like motif